jgi:hypothetical protein
MIEQGGTGAKSAGPMLKRIWDGLLGAGQPAVLPGSTAPTTLPKITPQVRVSGGSSDLPPALGGTGGAPAVPTYPPRPGGAR